MYLLRNLKRISVIVMICLSILSTAALTSCREKGDARISSALIEASSSSTQTSSGKSNSKLNKKILGKWTYKYEAPEGSQYLASYTKSYEFFDNGTVIYTSSTKDENWEHVLSYSILDETRIMIDGKGSSDNGVCNYKIEGKVLTLDGKDYIKE